MSASVLVLTKRLYVYEWLQYNGKWQNSEPRQHRSVKKQVEERFTKADQEANQLLNSGLRTKQTDMQHSQLSSVIVHAALPSVQWEVNNKTTGNLSIKHAKNAACSCLSNLYKTVF